MTYDEVQIGQKVRIVTATPKYRAKGVVNAKEMVDIEGREVPRVYVDTAYGRRLCAPSVLELEP